MQQDQASRYSGESCDSPVDPWKPLFIYSTWRYAISEQGFVFLKEETLQTIYLVDSMTQMSVFDLLWSMTRVKLDSNYLKNVFSKQSSKVNDVGWRKIVTFRSHKF